MKKIIAVIVILLLIGAAFIGVTYFQNTEKQSNELEKKIDVASRDYFEKYVSANDSANTYKITLQDLEEANMQGEKYDLKGLEHCDKTQTFADVTIDYTNGKAKKTQVELKC